MIKKVVILVNTNLYETKRHYAQGFCSALKRRGIDCHIIDMKGAALDTPDIESIKKLAPDFTCSFNTVSSLSSGRFLWDYIKIPHWTINLDPVVYVLNLRQSPFSIISTVDQLDCNMVKDTGFKNIFFWPHATEGDIDPGKRDRPLDVVMIGSCYDHEGLRELWPQRFSKELCKAMDEAVEIVLSDNCTPFMKAIQTSMEANQIDMEKVDLPSVIFNVDYYLRGKDRFESIKAIKNARVHLIGGIHTETFFGEKGWKRYLKNMPNVTVQSPIPFNESLKALQYFKLSLNCVPSFKYGSHVRVFSSFASGCLPVTNDNLYWREHFEDGEDIILYSHGQWGDINDRIDAILADDEKRSEMVEKGRKKVLAEHTWDARIETALKELPPILERINNAQV